MNISIDNRPFLVHQVLRTMNLEFHDEDDFIFAEGDWVIFLPPDDTSSVVISFEDQMSPCSAANIAMRFSRIMDMADINIFIAPNFNYSDSTSEAEYMVEE